jgi:hypothetical protein
MVRLLSVHAEVAAQHDAGSRTFRFETGTSHTCDVEPFQNDVVSGFE